MKRTELRELIRETLEEFVSEDYAGRKKLKDLSKNELKRLLLYHKQQALGVGPGTNKRTIENWHHVHMVRAIEKFLKIPTDKQTYPPKPKPSGGAGAGGASGTAGTTTPAKTRRKPLTPADKAANLDAWYKKRFGV